MVRGSYDLGAGSPRTPDEAYYILKECGGLLETTPGARQVLIDRYGENFKFSVLK